MTEPKKEVSTETTATLKERISNDIKLAMKAKDKIRLETIRSIKKVILEKETEVRPKGQDQLTPEQELDLLAQQAKQRRDSIEQYRQGGRDDLADKEAQELAIIETYLPAQLSAEEVEAIIDKIIESVGASSPKDMGKVMGPAMKELKGKADGKQVQEIVKAKLG
ncbi:GatB/YqeY domain-containing protein [Crocosphaera sp. Alani8]|uniref:GatB/YqeY domain-containing protein n=1 Tax=Crocosphaera sp. Alani8 TaxID=3038952 RepID=UPI00313BD024